MAQAHILIPYNSWACCAHQSSPKNTEASHVQNVVAETKLYGFLAWKNVKIAWCPLKPRGCNLKQYLPYTFDLSWKNKY